MFEKEAKEYTHTKHCEKCSTGHCEKKCILVKDDYEAFKDGAEFGYNKAFVEADKNLKAVVADFNKANEWHYVKDGDLPSEEGGWVCNQDGLPCYFDWSTEQWLDCEGTQIRTTEWCHMPHKE